MGGLLLLHVLPYLELDVFLPLETYDDGDELRLVGVMDAGPTVSVTLGYLEESLVSFRTPLNRFPLQLFDVHR